MVQGFDGFSLLQVFSSLSFSFCCYEEICFGVILRACGFYWTEVLESTGGGLRATHPDGLDFCVACLNAYDTWCFSLYGPHFLGRRSESASRWLSLSSQWDPLHG